MNTGNTPLIEVDGVYAKLECTNPLGSIKDRIAEYIINESERRGLLKPGMTIVEATSGNTGIAVSEVGRRKGYRVIIVMPSDMTEERKAIIRKNGAELIQVDAGNFAQAAQVRNQLVAQPGYFTTDQFDNPLNAECHYRTTGHEILWQMKERGNHIDAFVAGVGTGGTLIGVARALREEFPKIVIAAVEPTESAVMSGGTAGRHGISGIGDGFIPGLATDGKGNLSPYIDEVICVSTDEAETAAHRLRDQFGYCVGVSSGANFVAAKRLRQRFNTVATIFADSFHRYQSRGFKASEVGVGCEARCLCGENLGKEGCSE